MSGTTTVYATHFPSGEIAAYATRCSLIKSSNVIACFAPSAATLPLFAAPCALAPHAIAQHTAPTIKIFRIMFMDSSPENTATIPPAWVA